MNVGKKLLIIAFLRALKICMRKKRKLAVIKDVFGLITIWAYFMLFEPNLQPELRYCYCTYFTNIIIACHWIWNPFMLNSTLAWCCPRWDCDPRWPHWSHVDVWLQPGSPGLHRGHASTGNHGGIVPRLPQLWEDQWLPTTRGFQLVSCMEIFVL